MPAPSQTAAAAAAAMVLATSTAPGTQHVHAFVPSRPLARRTLLPRTQSGRLEKLELWNSLDIFATSDTEGIEKEVRKMKPKEMRDELQSYGISTKSFFEKKELADALVKARKEGKTSVVDDEASTERPPPKVDVSAANRHDKIQAEMEALQKMTVKELKKELDSYGVDHHFFEKSEFVKAVAEARVDGLEKKTTTRRTEKSAGFGSQTAGRTMKEEPYDPSYRDVVDRKLEDNMKAGLLLGGSVIDVSATRTSSEDMTIRFCKKNQCNIDTFVPLSLPANVNICHKIRCTQNNR
ncbi:hypothetical protein ACHAWF_007265 [Thalassiosira exigua]